MAGTNRFLAATASLVVLLSASPGADARIHHPVISKDTRNAWDVESFGFWAGGQVSVLVNNVQVRPANVKHRMGFVIYRAYSEADVSRQIQQVADEDSCVLDNPNVVALDISSLVNVDPNSPSAPDTNRSITATINIPGLYDIMFDHCEPKDPNRYVSFEAEIVFVNPGGNYLSAGEQPLPLLYLLEGIAFLAAFVVWVRYTRAHKAEMHMLHHLMTALMTCKVATLFFESAMYHYIALTGHSTGWNIAFYIATFLRGVLMITLVALIGAGWTLLKPFLNDREKKLLLLAIPLQVVSNIGIIVTDEIAPGTIAYHMWKNVMMLTDLVGAVLVLLPIVWSIKTLKDAQAADSADEKARNTLIRLTQFRSFYIMTLAYIYFTRVIVYLLLESLPFSRTWVARFCEESATLAFFYFVGYRFRPAADNSDYLQVPDEEDIPPGTTLAELQAAEAAGGTGAQNGDHDVVMSVSTSSNTRAMTSSQTVAVKPKAVPAPPPSAPSAPASAPGGGKAGGKVAIADDDKDDDFGLDEDDDLDIGIAVPSSAAAQKPTSVKPVRKEKQ